MNIRFGPAGLGGVKEAIGNLKSFSELGLKACEIAFTYGVYIKQKKDAEKIKKAAEKYNIKLSIHVPYWINLNSKEKEKIEASKKRVLRSCEVGSWLGVEKIVFHPGYYGGMDKEVSYQNIKKAILEIQEEIRKNKWWVKLCPETSGKINVFGSVDEILRLVEETKCGFCIDFAHIRARYKEVKYKETLERFSKFKTLHLHFSGIEFGEKGEKKHVLTKEGEARELIEALKKYAKGKEITIINESPDPVGDSVMMLNL